MTLNSETRHLHIGHVLEEIKRMTPEQKSSYTASLLEKWAVSTPQKNTLLATDNGKDGLLQIYGMLKLLFQYDEDLQNGWVRGANKAFDGQTPIDVMLSEKADGIDRVLQYLRAFLR